MANPSVPDSEEEQLLRKVGIDPRSVMVELHSDRMLVLLHLKTHIKIFLDLS